MTAVAAFAALALPLIALPALVGAFTKWWLKSKLRPKTEVGLAAGALYVLLLAILGGILNARAEGEDFMAIPFLMIFLGVLGVPIAVAVALRVRSTIEARAKPAPNMSLQRTRRRG